MPRKSLLFFLALLLVAAMGVNRVFSQDEFGKDMATFRAIMYRVLNHYVEDVESDRLLEGAYRGMLGTLDPYSQYFNQGETKTFSEDTEGKFGGLGIEITIKDGLLTVISPIRDTPAYDAGIMAGDVILKVDGKSTEGISLQQAVSHLRGKPGSKVVLTVRHPGRAVDTEITVIRAVINPSSTEYIMLDKKKGIAFIRISSFTAGVVGDMLKAIQDLQQQQMRALILDLRGNPGGLLNKAVEMSDAFLADGVIVSVRGRRPEATETYKAGDEGTFLESIPLVIMVNGGSASASEIVAAALRDNKRALLVGSRTYGKGSVQKLFRVGPGEVLKLTTARYYTPADKPIKDREGLVPDVVVPLSPEHLHALRNQEREDKLRGHNPLMGLIPQQDHEQPTKEEYLAPTPKTGAKPTRPERIIDYQLQAAFHMLQWKVGHAETAQAKQATP